jgi:hypothetical protein
MNDGEQWHQSTPLPRTCLCDLNGTVTQSLHGCDYNAVDAANVGGERAMRRLVIENIFPGGAKTVQFGPIHENRRLTSFFAGTFGDIRGHWDHWPVH